MKFLSKVFTLLALLTALAVLLFFSLPFPGTIPVLMYHFIGTPEEAAREGNFVSRESFKRQMAFLKKFNYHVLTMEEYAAIKSGKMKSHGREVLITFDDGHRSFKEDAFPVLKKYGLPAVMFAISDSVAKGRTKGYEDSLNSEEIRQLSKTPGITFEGHTKTHWHLRDMTPEQLDVELNQSKKELEEMLGKEIQYFAYPFGEFNRKVMEEVKKAGYELAFTTSFKKLEDIPEGPYCLTRVKVSKNADNPFVFWYNISGIHNLVKGIRQKIKYGFSPA